MNSELEYYKVNYISMISPKWKLMWLDIKSWLITSILMIAPIAIGQLIVVLEGKDLGVWSSVVLITLGALLKLLQKFSSATYYETK